MKFSVLVAFVLAMPLALFSQEYRGTIGGAVTDSTGATIAAAKVTVTAVETGAKAETVSDNTGHYAVPFLAPGDYSIVVAIAGFKEFVRKGVHLGAGELQFDIAAGASLRSMRFHRRRPGLPPRPGLTARLAAIDGGWRQSDGCAHHHQGRYPGPEHEESS